MQTVLLRSSDFDPVIASHAVRFHERLLGRWSPTALDATLIDTRTVHTFGLKESIGVVGIDEHLTVVAAAKLEPNHVVWFRKARYILELPADFDLPRVGSALEMSYV